MLGDTREMTGQDDKNNCHFLCAREAGGDILAVTGVALDSQEKVED